MDTSVKLLYFLLLCCNFVYGSDNRCIIPFCPRKLVSDHGISDYSALNRPELKVYRLSFDEKFEFLRMYQRNLH
jgi:hypothetical protein